VLTGRGAGIILIDDPLKPEEALSEAANDWFDHTLYSRQDDKQYGLCLRAAYNDGGFSGATIDRPALRQLLAEIRAGRSTPSLSTRSTG
jgi:hypothetical protein